MAFSLDCMYTHRCIHPHTYTREHADRHRRAQETRPSAQGQALLTGRTITHLESQPCTELTGPVSDITDKPCPGNNLKAEKQEYLLKGMESPQKTPGPGSPGEGSPAVYRQTEPHLYNESLWLKPVVLATLPYKHKD